MDYELKAHLRRSLARMSMRDLRWRPPGGPRGGRDALVSSRDWSAPTWPPACSRSHVWRTPLHCRPAWSLLQAVASPRIGMLGRDQRPRGLRFESQRVLRRVRQARRGGTGLDRSLTCAVGVTNVDVNRLRCSPWRRCEQKPTPMGEEG